MAGHYKNTIFSILTLLSQQKPGFHDLKKVQLSSETSDISYNITLITLLAPVAFH